MENNVSIINSIQNVRYLIHNSIQMLRDIDGALSKHGLIPIYGNTLGTETSKSINQNIDQYATLFPQYIARPYAPSSEINAKKVSKIIFINIQFYHGDYEEIVPALVSSIMIFPNAVENVKSFVQYYWLKWEAFENKHWDEIFKNGELNEDIDEEGIQTIFWCRELLSINNQQDLLEEMEKVLKIFDTQLNN